jgi:hypothetical protein
MRSRCCLCVYPPIVARQRLGKSPLIVARKRLGKIPPIVARQRLGINVTAITNTHATTNNCWTARFQWGPCRIKESRLLVLLRTSCCLGYRKIFQVEVIRGGPRIRCNRTLRPVQVLVA